MATVDTTISFSVVELGQLPSYGGGVHREGLRSGTGLLAMSGTSGESADCPMHTVSTQ